MITFTLSALIDSHHNITSHCNASILLRNCDSSPLLLGLSMGIATSAGQLPRRAPRYWRSWPSSFSARSRQSAKCSALNNLDLVRYVVLLHESGWSECTKGSSHILIRWLRSKGLDRELEALALQNSVRGLVKLHTGFRAAAVNSLGIVDPEEVAVQNSLNNSCQQGTWLQPALCRIPPDPIRNIQRSIHAEGKQIVSCDCFGLASPLKHEELGQDGHRLQPDTESP